MRNSGERAYAQESRDFFLKTVSMAGFFVPLIAACSSDRSRQPVTKVPVSDGLINEVYWELPFAVRGVATISFSPESFVKLRRERSLTGVFGNPVDPDYVFIFSAWTISMGFRFLASYNNIRVNDIRDYWEKDFYDLNTNIRNAFMTRWERGSFMEQTLNGVAFLPDGTKGNPKRTRQG